MSVRSAFMNYNNIWWHLEGPKLFRYWSSIDRYDDNLDRNVLYPEQMLCDTARMSYDHYFEKKKRFRKFATCHPYKIIRPYGCLKFLLLLLICLQRWWVYDSVVIRSETIYEKCISLNLDLFSSSSINIWRFFFSKRKTSKFHQISISCQALIPPSPSPL